MNLKLPSLGLGGIPNMSLNLSAIPAGSHKVENHSVYICIPYKSGNDNTIEEIKDSADTTFGPGTKVFQLTKIPEQWVIQAPENSETTIPTLQQIDSAYQDAENLPYLIGECDAENSQLNVQIGQLVTEIQSLLAEKEKLSVDNAKLEEKIKAIEEENQRLINASAEVKEKFEAFVKKDN